MPSKSKATRKQRSSVAKRKTQPHTRFNVRLVTAATPTATQVEELIRDSVAESTSKTYTSAENTLIKFLAALRQQPASGITLTSMTKEEFTSFLHSCRDQGISSTQTYRSALCKAQYAAGIPAWASEKQMIALAKGARGRHIPADKGVLTPDQISQLMQLIIDAEAYFVPHCKTCWQILRTSPALFNVCLADAIKFQWLARLRPGELEQLRKCDLLQTYETLHEASATAPATSVVVNQLNFTTPRKNGVGRYIISDDAALQFRVLSFYSPLETYLVPKCIDTHIGHAVGKGAQTLGLNPDLVWVAHGVRHSCFTNLTSNLTSAVDLFVAGVTSSVLRGTYTHNLSNH